jgi:hypothetical protein
MKVGKIKLGADHQTALISLDNLASKYMSQGRWQEVELLQVRSLEASRQSLELPIVTQ